MAIDIASLQLRINSNEAKLAKMELDGLTRAGGRAEKSTTSLTGASNLLAPALIAVAGASLAINKAFTVGSEFALLDAQLQSATGSAEGAAEAFEEIQRIAAETPFTLGGVTQSFVSLVNYGLTPSERAMKAYGDTASAMSKDISQMIEAVADAATGEFERLKEFGIKAKNQGDTIAFTFRGLTTEVGNNAQEIEEFLINLGETKFAGNMARQMDTISGLASNLGDSWDKLFLTINKAGVGDVMSEGLRLAIATIEELDDLIASGELLNNIEGIADKFDNVGKDIAETLDIVTGLLGVAAHDWGTTGAEGANFISDAFTEMPENVRATVQLLTVEIAALADTFISIWDVLSGKSAETLADIDKRVAETVSDMRDDILAERADALASFDAKIIGSNKLREAYEEQAKSRDKTDLTKFGVGATALTAEEKALNKYATSVKKVQTEYDLLIPKQEILNGLYEEGIISLETYAGQTEKLAKATKGAGADMERAWRDAGKALSQGIGDGVADAIYQTQTFEEAMNQTIENIGKKVIATIIDIGIQQVVSQVVWGGITGATTGGGANITPLPTGATTAIPSTPGSAPSGGLKAKAGATPAGDVSPGGGVVINVFVDASGTNDMELIEKAANAGARAGYEMVADDLRRGGALKKMVG